MMFKNLIIAITGVVFVGVQALTYEEALTHTWDKNITTIYYADNEDNYSLTPYSESLTSHSHSLEKRVSCGEFITEHWPSIVFIWGAWSTYTRNNALACLNMIKSQAKTRCGAASITANSGTCYCGAYFGPSNSEVGNADEWLGEITNNINLLGFPTISYSSAVAMDIENGKYRAGFAANCVGSSAWVSKQLSKFAQRQQDSEGNYGTFTANWGVARERP